MSRRLRHSGSVSGQMCWYVLAWDSIRGKNGEKYKASEDVLEEKLTELAVSLKNVSRREAQREFLGSSTG